MRIATKWTKNYTRGRVRPVRHIVIHTMEAPEDVDTAENIAAYFCRPGLLASAHYCIDDNSIVQGVKLSDTAWACPGFNASGVQLEHAGYAAQTAAQWGDDYSVRMLHRSARLAAQVATDYGIPVRRLSLQQIRNRTIPGFLGHGDATRAGVGGNTHSDPGSHFPWARYLDLVSGYQRGDAPAPPPKAAGEWIAGPRTVAAWQRFEGTTVDGHISSQDAGRRSTMPADHWTTVQWLPAGRARGSQLITAVQRRLDVAADGLMGPVTMRAVQGWLGVERDGIAGNRTVAALARKVGAA